MPDDGCSWLFFCGSNGRIVIMSVSIDGPVAQAGLREDYIISDIQGDETAVLARFVPMVSEK